MTLNGTRAVTVGILALQGDFREHREMLERMGHRAVEVRKPSQLEALDALVIPGGESTTIARLILSNGFQGPLRAFCATGRPVWGTCAGAILLAKEVDRLDRPGIEVMEISVHRNAFGRQVESFEADIEIDGLAGGPFHAVFIRAPVIERWESDVSVLAWQNERAVMARQGSVLVCAFHPELTPDRRIHEMFVRMVPGEETT